MDSTCESLPAELPPVVAAVCVGITPAGRCVVRTRGALNADDAKKLSRKLVLVASKLSLMALSPG